MASLLYNHISSFSLRSTSNQLHHKIPLMKPRNLKSSSSRLFKVKAEARSDLEIPKGLSKETIRMISNLKEEPDWMLTLRLNAYEEFLNMEEPKWSDNTYPMINFQDILNSLCSVAAVDVVLDGFSLATTHRETLEKEGVIFCSISEAIREYPDLVRKYLGKVVPNEDNYYAALNSALFRDGSFCYIPKNTKCSMPISAYFRSEAVETEQFERILIVADEGSFVEYLGGCPAPSTDRNQLHATVVELYCAEGAEIKYSSLQNWYAGDEQGKGGVYNFVTKRGLCAGARSKISWTQVETGSAITWKYPCVVLEGDASVGEFYSVALTNNYQHVDTGTRIIHKGKDTRSRIISKGISAGQSRNSYRGLVQILSTAENARNSSQCDFMLLGDNAAANTYPYIQVQNRTARVEHQASNSKIGEDHLFYFHQRGIDYEKAIAAMISGFCDPVFNKLPDELGAEVSQLMSLKLEG